MMMDGCGGAMMVLWSLLFVALIIGGAWLAVRAFRGGSSASANQGVSGSAALQILEERFARGEIDRDEFEDRRRTLSAS